MSKVLVSLAALWICAAASAQPAATQPVKAATGVSAPPPYTPVRWNESYAYLRDPAQRTDPFDPIKFIELGDEAYLSLGGQARARYEFFDNNNFGAGPQDNDGYGLFRFLLHADLHLNRNVRAFVQGKSAIEEGRTGGPRALDEDYLDLQQAFVDFRVPLENNHAITLRGGRQDLLYGAQRLISPLDWANIRRTFDGGKVSWAFENNTLDLFWVYVVNVDRTSYNKSSNDSFAGAYHTMMLPRLIEGAGTRAEFYGLSLNRPTGAYGQGAAGEDRYTVGTRLFTNPKPWDADLELTYQFGRFGGGDISAWSIASEAGYTVADCPMTPRMFFGFDIASGDRNPADEDLQTFNQLYPLGHAYFGYIDVIGRQNIIDLHPGIELTLAQDKSWARKLSLRTAYHLFWRQSNDDAVYNAGGGILRGDLGSNERYIGSELDLLLSWQVDRHVLTYIGYSHFFAGDFIEETGPSEDIDFFYIAAQFTF